MQRLLQQRTPALMAFWLAAVIIVVGMLVAVTHLSTGGPGSSVQLSAATLRHQKPCPTTTTKPGPKSKTGTYKDPHGGATQHQGDGQVPGPARGCVNPAPTASATSGATPTAVATGMAGMPGMDPTASAAPTGAAPPLDILATDCSKSTLPAHTGFQDGNRCVSTAFGEVASQDNDPSILISNAPQTVKVGQSFTISVSSRNLIRDRFLAAGQGGYYAESSLLNAAGLVRGHFHTACRMLTSTTTAPDPAPVPAFFVATEDGKGSATPDTVQVTVAGLPTPGEAQCAVWDGDGSHRVPMMQRANQIPAFDVVRITVK